MPFDRLVRCVDEWAGTRKYPDVFAQIGPTSYHPRHLRYAAFLEPVAFRAAFEMAQAVVAHAGMGTIITALEFGKPILVLPRRGDLAETRNDHQLATVRRLVALGLVEAAMDDVELPARLDELADRLCDGRCVPRGCLCAAGACPLAKSEICARRQPNQACPRLLGFLREYLNTTAKTPHEVWSTAARK